MYNKDMKAKISEIFKSIQGEGLYLGLNQIFVRFFGCNLRCSYCDTDLHSFNEMDVGEVLSAVLSHGFCHSISLTGGEPLLHVDFLKQLLPLFKSRYKTIYLETNGIFYDNFKEIKDYVDIVAMDFKLPSSCGCRDYFIEHERFLSLTLGKKVFVKAVVTEHTDIKDLAKLLYVMRNVSRDVPLILQPESPHEDNLRAKMDDYHKTALAYLPNVTVIPQIHKLMGVK